MLLVSCLRWKMLHCRDNLAHKASTSSSSLFVEQPELSILGSDMQFSRAIAGLKESKAPKISGAEGAEAATTIQDLPGRLVCVKPDSALSVVDTASIKLGDVRYACLSYVWGTDQNFQLLQSNKASLKIRFEFSVLPRTIQDAVTVTRRLGYSYLWVDAL
jgi:hypothetical protein